MFARKRSRTRRLNPTKITLAAVAITIVISSLCGMAWADKKGNSVIVAMTQEPMQFNPLIYENSGTENVPESCMFDAVWDVRPNGDFVPNLAVEVPTKENGGVSEDGLTWKIELKKGVKWQDGKPFTSADVEFTYKCIIDPKINVGRDRVGFQLIKEFKVIDDYHIEYTLSKPYAPMYWAWQKNHIVPKHVLSKVKDINTCEWNTTGTFGTGPYKLVKRVPGSHMVYKRNPDYHQGMPKIETVIHKFVPDQTVAYTQIVSGEIDFLGIMGIPAERYAEAQKLTKWDIMLNPEPSTEHVLFNNNKLWFKDKKVRQALYMSFDKDRVIKDVRYNTVTRTLTHLSPDHWAYNNDLEDPGYNPKKAAEMLDAAGWKIGPDGIREKDGKKMSFKFATTAGDKAREQAQLIFQQNLQDIGVEAKINNLTPPVMWGDHFFKGQFDMMFIGFPLVLGTDPDIGREFYMAKERFGCYADEEITKLTELGVTTVGKEERKKIYHRWEELFLDECCFSPLFVSNKVYAKKKDLGGYEVNPYNTDVTCFIQEWHWK